MTLPYMQAAVFDAFGGPEVLRLAELPVPTPRPDEVLVQVSAVGLNPKDSALRRGQFRWLTGRKFPKQTGSDLVGTVVAAGARVQGLAPGQRVFGYLEHLHGGAAAEYAAVPARWLAPLPAKLPDATAAALPCAALTALQALRDRARLQPGQRPLVYGASGGVGTAAVQLGKYLGAHVTAVSSSRNAAHCSAQGADVFLAYDQAEPWAGPERYDMFFQVYAQDVNLFVKARRVLAPRGTFVTVIPSPLLVLRGWGSRLLGGPRLATVLVRSRPADLTQLAELTEQGALRTHLDAVLPLTNLQAAHHRLDTGHTVGKLVLHIKPEASA